MHAFEPDHMAAVSTFVARRPTPRQAIGFGVKWAIGHGLSLLLIGSILFALKKALVQPTLFSSGVLDRVVGLVLIGLGGLMLFQLRSGATHSARQTPFQTPHIARVEVQTSEAESDELPLFGAPGAPPSAQAPAYVSLKNDSGSVWMGMLHGAAGTGAFVTQAALALSDTSYAMVFAYTLAFSVGVLLAMAFYAGMLGRALMWSEKRGAQAIRGARLATGLLTCVVGVCLALEVELPGFFDWVRH